MIEITRLSENNKNIHFKSLFSEEKKIELLIYKGFGGKIINSFDFDIKPNLEYWASINETFQDKKVVFRAKDTKKEILVKNYRKPIGLVEVWIGKIPEYFQYHIETIGTLSCVDFYFFTDDRGYDFSKIKHENFHVNYIDEVEFLDRFNKISKINIGKISHPKKIIDFKLAYF
jgi:hypothetical protein